MPKQRSLYAYEDRYKRVFAAGALNWNDPTPNPALSRLLQRLSEHSNCIEFGCGEGYQARFMASKGHSATAIDLSPTAIAKAVRETPRQLDIRFLVGDVTDAASLSLPDEDFDLAVDIGCLHMMTEDEHRSSYLRLVRTVLKAGGLFFLQEGLDDGNPEPQEDPSPRTILTAEGMREVTLPLLPCRFLSLEAYREELIALGFDVVSAEPTGRANTTRGADIVARKR